MTIKTPVDILAAAATAVDTVGSWSWVLGDPLLAVPGGVANLCFENGTIAGAGSVLGATIPRDEPIKPEVSRPFRGATYHSPEPSVVFTELVADGDHWNLVLVNPSPTTYDLSVNGDRLYLTVTNACAWNP